MLPMLVELFVYFYVACLCALCFSQSLKSKRLHMIAYDCVFLQITHVNVAALSKHCFASQDPLLQ